MKRGVLLTHDNECPFFKGESVRRACGVSDVVGTQTLCFAWGYWQKSSWAETKRGGTEISE